MPSRVRPITRPEVPLVQPGFGGSMSAAQSGVAACARCRELNALTAKKCLFCAAPLPWAIGFPFFEDIVRAEAEVRHFSLELSYLSTDLIDGQITADEWFNQLKRPVVNLHFAQAALARANGDRANALTADAWRVLEETIRTEYVALGTIVTDFKQNADAIRALPPDEEGIHPFVVRTERFSHMGFCTYENMAMWYNRERGHTEARRVCSDPPCCTECAAIAAKGWIKIETMTPLGQTKSNGNCSCALMSRRTAV